MKVVITVELLPDATEAQIDAFVAAVEAQVEDLESAEGEPLGDLPVSSLEVEVENA